MQNKSQLYWSHYWLIIEQAKKQGLDEAKKLELLKKLDEKYS